MSDARRAVARSVIAQTDFGGAKIQIRIVVENAEGYLTEDEMEKEVDRLAGEIMIAISRSELVPIPVSKQEVI